MVKTYNRSAFREFPTSQFMVHVMLFLFRSVIFVLFNTDLFQPVKPSNSVITIRKNFVFAFLFYVFQFYFIIKSLISENMYSFRLGIVVTIHNAILTIPVIIILLQASLSYRDLDLMFNWILTAIVFSTYILEAFSSHNFLMKMKDQKLNDQFFKICVDSNINEMYSIRIKTRIFTEIKAFLSFLDIGRYFFTPKDQFKRPVSFIIAVIILTFAEQALILVGFNDENTVQRAIAISINSLEVLFDVVTIHYLLKNLKKTTQMRTIVILITYIDILIATVVLGYFLLNDLRYFGKGLKERMRNRQFITMN